MRKSCGYTVPVSGINVLNGSQLYPLLFNASTIAEYKGSTYTPTYTAVIRSQIHRVCTLFNTVTDRLIPTIHTTNKNHKKFYTNNLLLISTGAV